MHDPTSHENIRQRLRATDAASDYPSVRDRIDHQKAVLNLYLQNLRPHRRSFVLCQIREDILNNPEQSVSNMPRHNASSATHPEPSTQRNKLAEHLARFAADTTSMAILMGLSLLGPLTVTALDFSVPPFGRAGAYTVLGLSVAGCIATLGLIPLRRKKAADKTDPTPVPALPPAQATPESTYFTLQAIDELLIDLAATQ
jgi:hypothetical protein